MTFGVDEHKRYQDFPLARSCAVDCRMRMLEAITSASRQIYKRSCDLGPTPDLLINYAFFSRAIEGSFV
jgi:hypothetical protein